MNKLANQEELNKLKQQIASNAGENLDGYSLMPQITVFNPNPNSKEPSEFQGGDIIKSVKTENGYQNEKIKTPFKANIIKIRMFLRTKKKFADSGVPYYITDEFNSYGDNEKINVKEKIGDKYETVFTGNYKQVNEKYSIRGEYSQEKYLELNHVMYVSFDLDKEELYKIVFKGTSRNKYFEYQKSFNRMKNEFMSTCWTIFSSVEVAENWKGEPLRFNVFAFDFKKGDQLNLGELKKSLKIQEQLEKDIYNREKSFNKTEIEGVNKDEEVKQIEESELPTINVDEDLGPSDEDIANAKKKLKEDEDEIKLEDIGF
jgi:hypothetical protein